MLIRSCASPAHSIPIVVPDGLFRVHGELVASDAWRELEGLDEPVHGGRPMRAAGIAAVSTDEDWDEWALFAADAVPFGWGA